MTLRKYNSVNNRQSAVHTSDGFVLKATPSSGKNAQPNFTINFTSGDSTSATISGTYPNIDISVIVQKGTNGTGGLVIYV